ncbi:hypothetical protein GCM10010123_18200 [Pilimelia anulata]|uniref:Uncharacterized protein n=1 Tax=Pilimelia anulata TaxID=53371 RepID=A0A8J3F9R9_9ACTN|nr:hypothetical protein [Pilimelia anulata]GGJ88973.1 hypothetical protein GCM10010123_18200 [Pilimelia anulata]
MASVEPLPAGDVVPDEGYYVIFEFDPGTAEMRKVGDTYATSAFSRREALEHAEAAALQQASRGGGLQYLVARVTPEGGFRPARG